MRKIGVGLLLAMLLATGLSALAACQPIGFISYVVGGEDSVKAVHKLARQPTVVLVDDPEQPPQLPSPQLRNLIAGRIGDALVRENRLKPRQVIGPEKISRLAAEHEDFAQWPIDKVGRAVGAEQVLYVLIAGFTVSEGQAIYEPTASARVKVIDAARGDRRFPEELRSAGHPVTTNQPIQPVENPSATTDLIVARRLAETLARDVARLFYKHTPEPVGNDLPG